MTLPVGTAPAMPTVAVTSAACTLASAETPLLAWTLTADADAVRLLKLALWPAPIRFTAKLAVAVLANALPLCVRVPPSRLSSQDLTPTASVPPRLAV